MSDPQHKGNPQSGVQVWKVHNKIDLGATITESPGSETSSVALKDGHGTDFRISAMRGDGIADLIDALVRFAQNFFGSADEGLIGRERQRKLLEQTAVSLRRSIAVVGAGEELAAEDLRLAANCLGRLLGRVDVEDILDVIFRQFCIGK
jgi:tRNA modification GTPase